MSAPVPPYFDQLIQAFQHGQAGRFVHLGHWDAPLTSAVHPDEFERAQARMNEILIELAELAPCQSVLDVGCGFGGTLESVDARVADSCLVGLNVDPRQLAICRELVSKNGNSLRWERGDACQLPFPDASFDRIFCVEAMFHFRSRRTFFAEVGRVLRPGGVFVASDMIVAPSARQLDAPGFCIEAPLREGYGPWPDPFCEEGSPRDLAAAAGMDTVRVLDATAATQASHRFTVPADADEDRDPGDASLRAGMMLRWLHQHGHLRYLYMRFDRSRG